MWCWEELVHTYDFIHSKIEEKTDNNVRALSNLSSRELYRVHITDKLVTELWGSCKLQVEHTLNWCVKSLKK